MRFDNKNVILPAPIVIDDRFRLESLENGSTVGLSKNMGALANKLEYSLDGGNSWLNLRTSTSITLNSGDKMLVRGKAFQGSGLYENTNFAITGKVAAKGSLLYLYDYENVATITKFDWKYVFCSLFKGCTGLIEAEIPNIVFGLKGNGTNDGAYYQMFNGCTQLNKIISYATGTASTDPYDGQVYQWVSGVSSTGDFYNLGNATYTSGVNGIPAGWTVHTSL